jgi:S1-C subfamily serine protease
MHSNVADLSSAFESLIAGVASRVVGVQAPRMRASGFVWRAGLVVTSDEALPDEGEVSVVLPGGESAAASVAGRDPSTALALLRCQRAQAAPVAAAAVAPPTGALAIAVGAEEGAPVACLGIVSVSRGPWRSMRGGDIDARVELDARLRRVAEGGLVVNAAGEALGMTVFGPRRRVLVIPSATIDRVAAKLESNGRIPRGYFGLGLQPVTLEGGGSGIMVMSVDPNGPGAAAKIYQGDVLIGCDGKPIGRMQSLLRTLGPDSIGKPCAFELRRGGQTVHVTLKIAERPAA